ncbi:hypothetical protein Tco_0832240 [Tanacetum coccineum]
MNPFFAQQVALDDALVAPDNRAMIGKCNMRIEPTKTHKEATYQVVLDTLKLSPCYKAFLVTADIPEIYMHQFWFTISKIKDSSSYQFKLDKRINHGEPSLLSLTNVFLGKLQVLTSSDFQEVKSCGIDSRQTTAARRSNMPYPRRQVEWAKQFRCMVSKEIIETTAYKTYLAFATRKTIHKKARKRRKAATTIMKESSLTIDDNIISEDPDVTLELAKSMNKTKVKEQEAAGLVHETHERIIAKKPTERRKQTGVVFRATPTVSKMETTWFNL